MAAYDATPEILRTVYLTNSLGEHTGRRAVPEAAEAWYSSVYAAAEDAGWLPYLTYRDGGEYLLLVQELVATDNDDYDEVDAALWLPAGYVALDDAGQHACLRAAVDAIADRMPAGPARLGYGEGTGIFGRDEAVVEVPVGSLDAAALASLLAGLEPFSPYGG